MTFDRCDFQVPPAVQGWYGILTETGSKAALWNGALERISEGPLGLMSRFLPPGIATLQGRPRFPANWVVTSYSEASK